MKGFVLKESCDVQPAMAKKMPLRIGQDQNKDRTVFHALVQLSDDNYYSIIANGFYNVSQINQIYLDGEPLTQQGKFTNKGKYLFGKVAIKVFQQIVTGNLSMFLAQLLVRKIALQIFRNKRFIKAKKHPFEVLFAILRGPERIRGCVDNQRFSLEK